MKLKRFVRKCAGLKAQIFAPEEEKEDLRRRYVFVCQELERTRAKVPPSAIRTS